MSKPPLHGRDHRVGGADPIPGLWGLPYFRIAAGSYTNLGNNAEGDIADFGSSATNDDGTVFVDEGSGSGSVKVIYDGALVVKASAYANAGTDSYVNLRLDKYDASNTIISGANRPAHFPRMNYQIPAEVVSPNYRRYWIDAIFLSSYVGEAGDYGRIVLSFYNKSGVNVDISDAVINVFWLGLVGGNRSESLF